MKKSCSAFLSLLLVLSLLAGAFAETTDTDTLVPENQIEDTEPVEVTPQEQAEFSIGMESALSVDETEISDTLISAPAENNASIIEANPQISVSYTGPAITKVYDKTRNVSLKITDFIIENGDALGVNVSKISASYDKADAGSRTVNVTVTLGGDNASLYGNKASVQIPALITPKELIITPTVDQKKAYGTSDPKNYTGKVKGLLSGDSITGKLGREPGENVGKYRITTGTISAGDNYDVQLTEEYFTIEPKSISSSDVGLVTIGNQRYTGQPITPEIILKYGKITLTQGTDFKAEFTDNVQPGMASVKLTGIGNYTDTRESSFRIQNTASGTTNEAGDYDSNTDIDAYISVQLDLNGFSLIVPALVVKAYSKELLCVGNQYEIDYADSGIVSCKSSNRRIIDITPDGLLTAKRAGYTKLTIKTDDNRKASFWVKVIDPYTPKKIKISQGKTATISLGESLQLSADLSPSTATTDLTWKSSKPNVAQVDANGLVTPLAEGKAKITVTTHNKKKASITVKVADPSKPTGVSIAQGKKYTMRVGETLQLNTALKPATAQSALSWKSSKSRVATVDASGTVTAQKKGTARITVTTYNKKKATITIKVVN